MDGMLLDILLNVRESDLKSRTLFSKVSHPSLASAPGPFSYRPNIKEEKVVWLCQKHVYKFVLQISDLRNLGIAEQLG